MTALPLRRALARLLDEGSFPLVGAALGAAGGASQSSDPTWGGIGGAMIGGMGGYGLRQGINALARRTFRPTLSDAPNIGEQLAGPIDNSVRARELRVRRRVADFIAPSARMASGALDELNAQQARDPLYMGDLLRLGRTGDEAELDARLRNFSARRDTPDGDANATLFGGAPFDPRRMRQAARLGLPPDLGPRDLWPRNPERWQALGRIYPVLRGRERLSRAIIMYSARNADGTPRYAMEDILAATGYATRKSLKDTINRARQLHAVPVPHRPRETAADRLPADERARLAEVAAARRVKREARRAELERRAAVAANNRSIADVIGSRSANNTRLRTAYDEADLINEMTTPDERGYYKRASDAAAALRDDEGEGAGAVSVQVHRIMKRVLAAQKQGDAAVARLAQFWNVTPDKLALFAERPWRNRFAITKEAERLVRAGVTDLRKLQNQLTLAAQANSRDVNESSIYQAALSALRNHRKRPGDALSILLPYLVTGGVGAAISTVADREAKRRAILEEMNSI